MKTFNPFLVLSLALVATACGELPPSKMREFDRQRETDNAREIIRDARISVTQLTWNSTGETDLQYTANFNTVRGTFLFAVSRANGLPSSTILELGEADDLALYAAMIGVFSGRLTPATSEAGLPASVVRIFPLNSGVVTTVNSPVLRLGEGSADDQFRRLNAFILKQLP